MTDNTNQTASDADTVATEDVLALVRDYINQNANARNYGIGEEVEGVFSRQFGLRFDPNSRGQLQLARNPERLEKAALARLVRRENRAEARELKTRLTEQFGLDTAERNDTYTITVKVTANQLRDAGWDERAETIPQYTANAVNPNDREAVQVEKVQAATVA
jgi:hypothetical protein